MMMSRLFSRRGWLTVTPDESHPTEEGLSLFHLLAIGAVGLLFVFSLAKTFLGATRPTPPATPLAHRRPLSAVSPSPNPPVAISTTVEASVGPVASTDTLDRGSSESSVGSGAAVLGGAVPPALSGGLSSTATFKSPAPSSPSPKVLDVSRPLPPPVPPPPEPRAAPTPLPLPSPTSVSLRGRATRRTPLGAVLPLSHQPVYLLDVLDDVTRTTTTDMHGVYHFGRLKPGHFFYLVMMHAQSVTVGHHMEYEVRYPWGDVQSVAQRVQEQESWHLSFEAPGVAGTYALDLDHGNQDPHYCADIQPTNDPVTRAPYSSCSSVILVPYVDDTPPPPRAGKARGGAPAPSPEPVTSPGPAVGPAGGGGGGETGSGQ